jgi:choline dehydrogenase
MVDEQFDYVIVGAGASGCVLAYRLSENPNISVALIEAGGNDTYPLFHVPKAVPQVMGRQKSIWAFPVEPETGTANKSETWVRGKVIGGSTTINGLMYVRGQPADFDAIAEVSSDDWNWDHIGAAYEALENHQLGKGETRGDKGPLRLTLPGRDVRGPWHQAVLDAGAAMGLPVLEDVNAPTNGEAIGYASRNIWKGRRQSAAVAFLAPARHRRNLTIVTNAVCDTVELDGKRVTGVNVIEGAQTRKIRGKEIVLCGGAMSTPGILERSGIGDSSVLAPLGIDLKHSLPNVGKHLVEHRALLMQWKVKDRRYSFNHVYHGWRLSFEILRYIFTRRGPMTSATFDMGAWVKSRPGLNRPDTQFLVAPHSVDFAKLGKTTEQFPGMSAVIYALRPTSVGNVHITSRDPLAPPRTVPNHRSTQDDRQAMIDGLKAARRFAHSGPLKDIIVEETVPGPQYQSDDELIQAYDTYATCGYHAVGSCRMGKDQDSVVDPELRVRGLDGLRIMDTSIMPVIPSGNTNGPTMAMAWRAADIFMRDR